jgi:tetratricopeptide (TPR) repeat protein
VTESQVFAEALKRSSPAERAAYLDEACAGDPQLRAGVEALLQAHATDPSFLEQPAAGLEGTAGSPPSPVAPGEPPTAPGSAEQVGVLLAGRYKLLELIGEGGMGTVWMAQQTEPVKRLVAVKLIKAGMDSRAVLARFEAERQALALMDHPNIARVFDAGAAPDGRPFFVMELVKGVPITRFCDERRLTPRQRLELFVPVCQAIQHAHQKGIIHRDVKPSNVLVALYDDRPVPKVIDFGVAKAAGQQLTEKTLHTGFGAVVGTVEYMSPEQASFNQLDVDTRSDVYALGVLLYELLAGSPPFSRRDLEKAGVLEMFRLIREQEPPKPSTRLSTAEGLPTLAANRGTEPKRVTAVLRGEIDWIVMKALEKDRTRRYETANGFAMDVQRYLAGEPVLAAPASQWYRLRKLVRRHRGPVLAAGLVLLTLLVGIAGTTWGLLRAEQQRQVAEAKKQEAVDERDAKDAALKAEQQARKDETKARQQAFAALRSMTADVVERKFAQGTVLTEDDRAFLRGVIAQFDAFAAIKGDDADSRALQAEGRLRVGAMRHRLGELKEAEEDYGRAVSMSQRLAADFPSRPEFRQQLAKGHANRGLLLRDTGRLKEAEQDYGQALGIQKHLTAEFPGRHEFRQDLAISLANRGGLLSHTGRLKEGEEDYGQALAIHKRLAADFPSRPEFRHELAMILNNRGNLLADTGRPKEAEEDYGQALAIHKQLAADFPSRPEFRHELGASHANRGLLLRETGRLKEAEQDVEQALAILKQLAAEFPTRLEFRHELAASHNIRGTLLSATGRPKEAEEDYGQALAIHKRLAADFPNRPDMRNELAGTCVNLALLHQQQGNWAAAKRLLAEGRPHHLAALEANPRNPTYRQFYRNHLGALTGVHAGLLEPEDAVRTAEACRGLGWGPPADAYSAACGLSLCIPNVAKHEKLDDRQRKEAAQFYGDAAMRLLREAVSRGYKDVTHMKKDADLDPLRSREDFRKLVAELEGKSK